MIPGTRIIACELCGSPTRFAPSSLNRPEAAGATFVCMACAEGKATDETEIAGPTDEQLREMRLACASELKAPAPDGVLEDLQRIYLLKVIFGERVPSVPELPAANMLSLIDELIARRRGQP
jgi:hypothetical protein